MGDHLRPKIVQIGPVVQALEQFSRMQSEREQTLGAVYVCGGHKGGKYKLEAPVCGAELEAVAGNTGFETNMVAGGRPWPTR